MANNQRKQLIAFRLAEEIRRIVLLVDFCGLSDLAQRRLERLSRLISYYRQNQ